MRLGAVLATVAATLVGCADDGPAAPTSPAIVCAALQAWSDQTVDAVEGFRIASRELDPSTRRLRYAEAFTDAEGERAELERYLDGLVLDQVVADRIGRALDVVAQTYADGAAEAAALPDAAYEFVAVRDGSLVTDSEKVRAVVFRALTELSDDPATGIPRGCGRRAALDLSPSVTYP